MILLVGVTGAGKSVQGQLLAKDLNCAWISSGEIFRSFFKKTNDNKLMDGRLINDKETINVIEKELNKHINDKEFVLDGFPRTLTQAEWLIKNVDAGKFHLTLIVNLDASIEVVKERLIARGREDDKDQIIERRFDEFNKKTLPIINYYKNSNLPLLTINADQSPEDIHALIMKHLNEAKENVHESQNK